jgi:hypothetical protein
MQCFFVRDHLKKAVSGHGIVLESRRGSDFVNGNIGYGGIAMTTEKKEQGVSLQSETGAQLMLLQAFHREGKTMIIEGTVVDSWPSRLYVDYRDAWRMFLKLMTWEMIKYSLILPFWVLRDKWRGSRKDRG